MHGKMTTIQKVDCPDNDIVHYRVGTNNINSEEDCKNECLSRDECGATAYGSGYCWLKRKAVNFNNNNNRNCSYKDAPLVPLSGIDAYGDDIKSFGNTSAEECLSYCQNDPKCDTYTHAPKENYCWIKNKYGKNMNYKVNGDRNTVLVRPFTGKGYGTEHNSGDKAAYDQYQDALNSYKDAKLIKSVMERNNARLGSMEGESTVKPTALDLYKTKLQRENQQQQTEQRATADANNMSKKLSGAYDQLIDDNIDGINNLDHAIENKHYLIKENNKSAAEKNKSIYILSYFLILLLLIAVIFLCTFLGIISSRIALGLSIVAGLFFLFNLVYKYYWDGIDSEAVALKKMIYTGTKDLGQDIRDTVLPKWVYSCPKRCKKKPDHMKPHPSHGKFYTDAPDLKTDSSENVWVQGIDSPTTYNCQWQGPSDEIEVDKQCFNSTIPCDEYLGYKAVEICN